MTTQDNIAILGAGITGLMNAYALSKAGHTVTLYDPKGFPPEQSSNSASLMAGGMLAPYSEIEHMDDEWVHAGLASIDIWKGLDIDCGFTQNGSLLIAHAEDRHILERLKTHLPAALQAPQKPQTIEPALPPSFTNGIYLPQEAHLDPIKTMQNLCSALEKTIILKPEAACPETLDADIIIDCRGMGANDPDLRGVKGETLTVRNPEFSLTRPIRLMHPRYPLYIIPRADNVFMIGATVIESDKNETPSLRSSMELMSALYTLAPSFADSEIIDIKAGIRPSYTDNLPHIKQSGNIISCNGMFRHGYLFAPIMAQCVKDIMAQKDNTYLHLFKGQNDEDNNQRAA